MKSLLLFAFILTFSLTSVLHADVPALKAPEAAAIAQADLVERGLDTTVFIAEVDYKKEALMTGPAHWEVLWSKEFAAQMEGRKEIGIHIAMDGTYKRAVK